MGHLVRLSYPDALSGSFALASHADPSTPGTAYSDWECTVADPVRVLSAAGRRTFYVKAATDVVVYDADGVTVDTFTEGVRAELVGVNALSLTGTLPDGTQGGGGDISLADFVAAVRTSFGANNLKVRETGQASDLLLKDALANVRSANLPYFNVKSAPYNAIGDGVNIDVTAIQAAIAAASAAGGGVVYLPRGTYQCPTGLSITDRNVSLYGDGPGASTVRFTGAGFAVSVVGSGAIAGNSISNLAISTTSTSSGAKALTIATNPGFRLFGCLIQTAGQSAGAITTTTSCLIANNYLDVVLQLAGSNGVVEIGTGALSVNITGNISAQSWLGTNFCFYNSATATAAVTISNNTFNQGSSASYLLFCNTGSGLSGMFTVSGNTGAFGKSVILNVGGLASNVRETANQSGVQVSGICTGNIVSTSRQKTALIASSATLSVNALDNNDAFMDATSTPVAVSDPGTAWDGCDLQIVIRNTLGGALTINYNAVFLGTGALGTLAAGATRTTVFRRKESGTTPGWRLVSSVDAA